MCQPGTIPLSKCIRFNKTFLNTEVVFLSLFTIKDTVHSLDYLSNGNKKKISYVCNSHLHIICLHYIYFKFFQNVMNGPIMIHMLVAADKYLFYYFNH